MSTGIFAHWPNRITGVRFVGALVLFVIFSVWGDPEAGRVGAPAPPSRAVMQVCFWLFVLVAATDFVDGYLARRDNLVTAFGRIADPFVDKVLILGALIYLSVMSWSSHWMPAWIVVVVLAREFLVTGIRGYVESLGLEFGADRFGKIKMVIQCIAVAAILAYHAFPWPGILDDFLYLGAHVFVWGTLLTSVGSGLSYVVKTRRLLEETTP